MIDFQDLFPSERIVDIQELSPGYEDHASDVWRVKTDAREVIVRASGVGDVACASTFFRSANILFGINPANVFALEAVHHTLSGLGAFVYPRILEKHRLDREYAVVELLPGSTLESFMDLSNDELRKFGQNLARIHGNRLDYWGNPAGTFSIAMEEVNGHIIRSMREIIGGFYSDDRKIKGCLPEMERILSVLPAPECASYVLVDMDPTQFLVDDGRITGLVDTEAYVIAPREFDFVALEYVLDRRAARLVSEGYEAILPLPDLRPVRTAYRYLYRLIEVQSADDVDDWLSQPALFE